MAYTVVPPKPPNMFFKVDISHICGHLVTHRPITSDAGIAHSIGRERQKDRCPDCVGKVTRGMVDELNQRAEVTECTSRRMEVTFDSAEPLSAATTAGLKERVGPQVVPPKGQRSPQTLMGTFLDHIMAAGRDEPLLIAEWKAILWEARESWLTTGCTPKEVMYLMSEGTRKAVARALIGGEPTNLAEIYLFDVPVVTAPRLNAGEVFVVADMFSDVWKTEERIQFHLDAGPDDDKLYYIGAMPVLGLGTHSSRNQKTTTSPVKEKTMKRLVFTDVNPNLNGTLKEVTETQLDGSKGSQFFGTGFKHTLRTVRLVGRGAVLEVEVFARPSMTQAAIESKVAAHFNVVYYNTSRQNFDEDRSDWVAGYGYNYAQEVLDVHTKTGGSYRYFDVKLEDVLQWLASGSLGSHYNTRIKGKFDSAKL